MSIKRITLAALSMAFLTFVISAQGAANTKLCSVSRIGYDNSRAWITCDEGGIFYALPSCADHTLTVDTIRTWVGMCQASLLSGKKVSIVYESTNPNSCVYSVELLK